MKRTLAFLMTALFLTMLLIGCGTTTTEAGKTTPLPTSPSGKSTVPTDTAGTTSETQGETVDFKGEDVRLALLTGSTGLGASKLISDSKKNETVNRYTIDLTGDPTEVIAGLKTGKYDLAALPVNVAAKLYNMPDVEVQVVALNTLGVLYVLENETETVQSVADLKEKTIYTTGEGATPQYILEYLLKENGLKALLVKSKHKLQGIDNDYDYGEWYSLTKPTAEELEEQRKKVFDAPVKFSIVIPAFKTPERFLREMLDSIAEQTYANWEVCVADGSPAGQSCERVLEQYAKKDSRFKYVILGENKGISGNTNAAMDMATGDYIVLADHDDKLTPNALYECAKLLQEHPGCDCFYSDEDKLDMDGGALFDPHFKPDFNIDLLCSVNYICHLFVVSHDLAAQVGGFRQEYDGAQDYDFIFRCTEKLIEDTKMKLSLDDLFSQIKAGNVKELPLIVKADVQGSVEAVKQSLMKLSNEEVVVKVIHGGVGAINESDVSLAAASNAIIIGFNVRPDATAKSIAEREKVDVRLYRVIYQAIEDVEAAMKGMLDPIYEEQVIGHAVVRQTFKASGVGTIAGSYVLDGKFQRGCKARITRDGEQIFDGPLASLKRFKDDVKEVASGYECGLVFEKFNDLQEDDMIEAYAMVEVPR